MGGNFCEKLEEAPRIKFCGFNFCGATSIAYTGNVNFELGTRRAVDENRWNALVSSLV